MLKTEVVTSKVFWKSKTFQVNTLALCGALFMAMSGEIAMSGTLTLAALVNIILRMMTKQGISLSQ